jgi:biotin synthase-like enzyme
MKKKNLKTLQLNKKSVSNLDTINGGAPIPIPTYLSIVITCVKFTCGYCAYSGQTCDPSQEP